MMATQTAARIVRYVLAFQLVMGGQCRLTNRLTPKVTEIAYENAEGYKRYIPIIPGSTATEHTRNLGALLLTAGLLLIVPSRREVRAIGAALSGSLSTMLLYAQYSMGLPPWLPAVNGVLAGSVLYFEYFQWW